MRQQTRRGFLEVSSLAVGQALLPAALSTREAEAREAAPAAGTVHVVVWDERQPAQKEAYKNFLGNRIADYLRTLPGLSVTSVALDDPEQGLASSVLENCDVLIWWGHVRHAEVTPETGQKIMARIKAGRLALIALHSAHWSTPFVEAMFERTRHDAERRHRASAGGRVEIRYIPPPQRYTLPKYDSRLTPYELLRKFPDGRETVTVHLPYCCFPAYRHDGKPSHVRVLRPDHPIAEGLPREFTISKTEMYDEPFHVPEPDEVIFEERWESGEWFRSGAVWSVGEGRVFYFRPGHETYPVYQEEAPLKVLGNAVRWLAPKGR